MTNAQIPQANRVNNEARNSESSAIDASKGPKLAKALIQQILDVRAAGFEDELLVDGEVWMVRVHRKARVS